MYVGRFAPSPTGPLHFGSLVAALGSWLDARAAGGRWLVRIEDLDAPRTAPGASDDILRTLEGLGLHWDGEVMFQSRRRALYRAALESIASHTYPCACSRREIADSSLGMAGDGAPIYPGTCRGGIGQRPARSVRVRVEAGSVAFPDRLRGTIEDDVCATAGDFVVSRTDGSFAYQLAVVVDDASQGVTDVVRGADLLGSTGRQVHLQRLLGYPTPRYLHLPVALDARGEKLSKQTGAARVGPQDRSAVQEALRFLNQPVTQDLCEAVGNWDASRVPREQAYRVA